MHTCSRAYYTNMHKKLNLRKIRSNQNTSIVILSIDSIYRSSTELSKSLADELILHIHVYLHVNSPHTFFCLFRVVQTRRRMSSRQDVVPHRIEYKDRSLAVLHHVLSMGDVAAAAAADADSGLVTLFHSHVTSG